jgi:hypothetical protein
MMTKDAMSNLASDPPAKPMHDRAHEPGALVGGKDRDHATDQADNDKGSHEFAPSIRWGKVKSPARAHMTRSSSTE